MTWLSGIIVTTPELARLRDFYERGLGLRVAQASETRIEYATRGAMLVLEAGASAGMRLAFGADDFERRLATLTQRLGKTAPVAGAAGARSLTLTAPGGVTLACDERSPTPSGDGVRLSHAILVATDLDAELRFWREALGLKLTEEHEHWLEFDGGTAALAVHERTGGTGPPLHPDQRVSFALEWEDLDAAVEAVRGRGFSLATAPAEEAFGRFAEIEDPDGMIVVLRGPGIEDPIEEQLAEDWADEDEDDDESGGRRMRERENPGARRVTKPASQQRSQQRKAAEKAGTQAFEEPPRSRPSYSSSGSASRPPRPEGGFTPRPPRPEGGFTPRPPRPEGSSTPRPPRPEGSFTPRPRSEGGFTPRPRPEGSTARPPRPSTPGDGASRPLDDARRGGARPTSSRPQRPADRGPSTAPRSPRPPRRDES